MIEGNKIELKDTEEGSKLVSTTNVDQPKIEESKNITGLTDIFSDAFTDIESVAQIANYKEKFKKELDAMSVPLFGSKLSTFQIDTVIEKINNRNIDSLSESEMDKIFEAAKLTLHLKDTIQDVEGMDIIEFKKSLLDIVASTKHADELFANAQTQLKKTQESFNTELSDLLTNIDLTQQLKQIETALAEEIDPVKKEKLNNLYIGIFSSINLNMIMDKIKNKPLSILKKECKKDYATAKKKCLKIMNNDKKNMMLSIVNLDAYLLEIFKVQKDQVKLFMFIIYKHVNKRKTIDKQTATFINFFTLSVTKLYNNGFAETKPEIYLNIEKTLEILK